ncbi:hypothetical protein [Jatrophihabitans endophyticus]|uniref:hypothetical protein n=1 Tax=Jatrophihabitans endophyticus TaxID=1206085 RepID=UPI0019EA8427|nr:hypothetical protein [Jatrophihabitans endophyticus]MBE7189485.1 hypothetical protein [Jatrophihabitans endophyticus]
MSEGLAMHSPDGRWSVQQVISRAGEQFLVRERIVRGTTTTIVGQMVTTLEQVCVLVGDAFDLLVDD